MLSKAVVDTDTIWLSNFRQDANSSLSDTELCILLQMVSQTSSQSIISQHSFALTVIQDELAAQQLSCQHPDVLIEEAIASTGR